MCHSTAVAELPESSIWRGKLSAEEAEQARQRHRALVEAWLDFACFADELFKLHKKYHVANGEAGYVAYRQYLKKQEEKYLADYGLTADPLNEGCQCVFCISHPEKKSATSPSTPEPQEHGKVRCADQSNDRRVEHGPRGGPYDRSNRGKKKTRRNPYRNVSQIRVRGSPPTCQKKTSVG